MKHRGRVKARDAISALLRKTLGTRPDPPAATDLGTDDQLPKMSVLSPQQRRAIFAKGRRPPK